MSRSEEAKAHQTDLLDLAVYHLRMLEYGANLRFPGPTSEIDSVPRHYNLFCLLHLISALFLVEGVGFLGNVLPTLGLATELDPVNRLLATPIAKTTFGDFIRVNRNKLATHGDLSFESLPDAQKSIPFDDDAAQHFEEVMETFVAEVTALRERLQVRLPAST